MLSFSLALALMISVPAPARAATPATDATATAIVLRPLTLLRLRNLDFGGLLSSATAGTAILEPSSGAVTTTGGVVAASGPTTSARFIGAGTRKTPVIVRIPKNPVTLTRVGGTETMTVSNWTMDGATTRIIQENETFEFRVGGTLNVAANQMQGTYVGTFDVTAQYP